MTHVIYNADLTKRGKILRKNFITALSLTFLSLLIISAGQAQASSPNTPTDGKIQITSLDGTTTQLTYNDITALPAVTENAYLFCYNTLIDQGDWTGARLSSVLESVGIATENGSIVFTAQDGYTISLPLTMAMQPYVLIAYQKDGEPLPETYRLVVPQGNGNLWVAMLTTITMSEAEAVIPPMWDPTETTKQQTEINQDQTNKTANQQKTSSQQSEEPKPQTTPTPTSTTPPANVDQSTNLQAEQRNANLPIAYIAAGVAAVVLATTATGLMIHRRKTT